MIKIQAKDFNLKHTLESGQFFHFTKLDNDTYIIVIKDKIVKIYQKSDSLYIDSFPKISGDEINNFFNLNTNYHSIINYISKKDKELENMISKYYGLRIINQDIEECIFSYILSSFNNIKKIQSSVKLLSTYLGDEIKDGIFAFPTVEVLKNAKDDILKLSKTGFRGKYIKESARIMFHNNIDYNKKDEDIKKILLTLPGIGEKVSDCIMLYSLKRYNVFPKDIWIKRYIKEKEDYEKKFKKYRGWAQLYIYSSMRNIK